MEEQKKVNPLATEKEGKLIAKFAIQIGRAHV